jgi:hypothetical protein
MDGVLQEMGFAVLAVRLLQRPEPVPQGCCDPRTPMVFDEQDAESVVQHKFVDVDAERSPSFRPYGGRRLGGRSRQPVARHQAAQTDGDADGDEAWMGHTLASV